MIPFQKRLPARGEPLGRESFDPERTTEGLGAERLGRAEGLRRFNGVTEWGIPWLPPLGGRENREGGEFTRP